MIRDSQKKAIKEYNKRMKAQGYIRATFLILPQWKTAIKILIKMKKSDLSKSFTKH